MDMDINSPFFGDSQYNFQTDVSQLEMYSLNEMLHSLMEAVLKSSRLRWAVDEGSGQLSHKKTEFIFRVLSVV